MIEIHVQNGPVSLKNGQKYIELVYLNSFYVLILLLKSVCFGASQWRSWDNIADLIGDPIHLPYSNPLFTAEKWLNPYIVWTFIFEY